MPHMNRVNPSGQLVATPEKGFWMGNRGVLHNGKQEVTAQFRIKAWITCRLDLPRTFGNPGEVMIPGHYTELFFLDEATAFAAGHRPCGQCRRGRYDEFKAAWLRASPGHDNSGDPPIGAIDQCIHAERMEPGGGKASFQEDFDTLPDGTFIVFKNEPHLIWRRRLFRWSFAGYEVQKLKPTKDVVTVLTPGSIVRMFAKGFVPQVHQSAFC
jgi:hypothetical protein